MCASYGEWRRRLDVCRFVRRPRLAERHDPLELRELERERDLEEEKLRLRLNRFFRLRGRPRCFGDFERECLRR